MPATISAPVAVFGLPHSMMRELFFFFPQAGVGIGDECRWYGRCKALLFSLGSERVILPGAEVWGLAFGIRCLGAELILGFLGGNTPGYVSPQDGRE